MTQTAIGVDLGGSKALVGVVGAGPEVMHSSLAESSGLGPEELVDVLVEEIMAAQDTEPRASAIGLGIPSRIDRRRGLSIEAVNLSLAGVPIRELIAARCGLPTFIDNDANVAALAEHRFGAARSARNAVMLTVGTGIGGGLVIDGELYRGSTGSGAELGHVVIEADGPPCQGNCPNRGCVEALASGTAIAREGRSAAERTPDSELGRMLAAGTEIDGRAVTEAGMEGDEVAREVLALIGRRLGVALASLTNVFEPDVLVVGGGAMAAGELILGPAREEMRHRALRPQSEVPVLAAELGPRAGMIGAAAMAMIEAGAGEPWPVG